MIYFNICIVLFRWWWYESSWWTSDR